MKKLPLFFLCLVLVLNACTKTPEPTIIIFPDQCTVTAGGELPISLKGTNIPSGEEVQWTATKGKIVPPTGYSVIYTAPDQPGSVIINAILEVDGKEFSTALPCTVTSIPIATVATDTPLPASPTLELPTLEPTIEPTQGPTLEPTLSIPPTSSGSSGETIAITEVMPFPCGFTDSLPSVNEYIELYNYGTADVNVGGWWIGTRGGGQGTPDQLVTWTSVNPKVNLGTGLILNDTVIAPGGFAVVISPIYHTSLGKYKMPYAFQQGTTILTFPSSDYVGNDSKGLTASAYPLTTIVLYKGTEDVISTVVSTYGTPSYGSTPDNIADDKADNFPYFISQCHAMERINAVKPDSLNNWREINILSPGSGNYEK
jgi:hypothetical protein